MPDSSKTVDKMVLILKALADGRIVSAKSLAEDLDMNRTVVQRLLATLIAHDYVARPDGEGYALSFHVHALGRLVLPELREAAGPVARDLASRVGETVTVHVTDGLDAVVVLEQTAPEATLSVRHRVGARSPLGRGASGKVLLAFAGDRMGSRVAASRPGEWRVEALAEIRSLGYATSRDELQAGVHAVAAPILDDEGRVAASIAILCPASREVQVSDWSGDVTTAARLIQQRSVENLRVARIPNTSPR